MKLMISRNHVVHILFFIITVMIVFLGAGRMDEKEEEIAETTEVKIRPEKITYAEQVAQQFDTFFKSEVAHNTPGAAVVIVKDTNVVLLKPYGVKKTGTNDSVNIHTTFRLASVSKGFAGVLTGLMVNDGAFSLNDRVKDHLPEFMLKDTFNTHHMQVEHLLTHTTGLVPHAFDNLIEANMTLDDIIPRLKEVSIHGDPGAYYGYQNVIFSMIGKVMESAGGKTYCDLIHEKIFNPLKMYDASCDYTNFMANTNKAEPHLGRDGRWRTVSIDPAYYHVLPAAGVNASASDMAGWIMALLGNNQEVIPSQALEMAFSPRITTPLRYAYTKHWNKVDEKHYGLGWRIYDYNERKIMYHGGYVKGYRAEVALCPEEDIGIAVMTNAPCELVNLSIPAFFNMYFDKDEPQPGLTPQKVQHAGHVPRQDTILLDDITRMTTGNQ